MNPDTLVKNEWGELRPECFGKTGYGDGYAYPGRCDVRVCKSGGYCYAKLRDEVESRDPEAAAEYEARRKVLREEGLDSRTIVTILAAQGFPPTTQDAVLENTRQGQIASGRWRECEHENCVRLIANTRTFCGQHQPKEEDDDGPARDRRELQAGAPAPAAKGDPAPPPARRFGRASDPLPPLQ